MALNGGFLYVANAGGQILRYDATCSTTSCAAANFVTGLSTPHDIVFDGTGNAYITELGAARVARVAAGCAVPCAATIFATNAGVPLGITIASNGDVFAVSDPGGNSDLKRAASGCVQPCTMTSFATLAPGSRGIIAAGSGDLLVANTGGTVQRITSAAVVTTYTTTTGAAYEDLSIGPDGRAYLANTNNRIDALVLPAAPVPTLSEWAMILFGLILAGGAALYIQRRQMLA